MSAHYREFGVCQKAILAAGQSANLTSSPQVVKALAPASKMSFMHVITMGAANVTVTFVFDLGASGPYTFDFTGQSQLAGVASITVNSGTVEVLLFS